MGGYRPVLLAVLLYVGLDFSLPMLPGAFVFDAEGSVESARGRGRSEIRPMVVHDASPRSELSGEVGNRPCVGRRSVTTASRPYANVFRSDDGGRTFTQCIRPQPAAGQFDVAGALNGSEVFDLAVSPVDSNVVVAVTRYDVRSAPRHGIYRSIDGGISWTLVHQF